MLQRTGTWVMGLTVLSACILPGCRTASKASYTASPVAKSSEFAVQPIGGIAEPTSRAASYEAPLSATQVVAASGQEQAASKMPGNDSGAEISQPVSELKVTGETRSSVSDSLMFNRTYTSPTSGCTKGCCANR